MAAYNAGARIIAIDRPGFGGSDFKLGRSIDNWPADVGCILDFLRISEFSILGVSGGAPYAMVCSIAFGKRIRRLALVCGMGQMHDVDKRRALRSSIGLLAGFAARMPGAASVTYRYGLSQMMRRFPGLTLNFIAVSGNNNDRDVLRRAAVRQTLIDSISDAFRNGGAGPVWEFRLFTRPWPFSVADVKVPTLIYHGARDNTVPLSVAERHAQQIANSDLMVYPDEGHFSLPIKHMCNIVIELVA
jgi:pimeloyl-ACP methyl ester carboxylesterase